MNYVSVSSRVPVPVLAGMFGFGIASSYSAAVMVGNLYDQTKPAQRVSTALSRQANPDLLV